jgi:hypothetical protein
MTHQDDQPPSEPRETDETLREAQTGKGYGEDEGEREAAVREGGDDEREAEDVEQP